MTSKAKEILEKAKKDLDNTIFPEGTPEYLKKSMVILNKFELNDLLDSLERLEQLEQENQELKEEIEKESKLSTRATKAYLEKNAENETLKNAIEIFKENFKVINNNGTYELYFSNGCIKDCYIMDVTQQEYDLLKEVLGNEIYK